ncbi:MAG: DUF3127 domain-containing protein [Chitinophagaceae bacterium]
MDISGKLIQMLPAQEGQGKNGTWKKQEFVIETGDTYPKKVCIAAWGDKIDLKKFKMGDAVDVSFDVESREYNGKWYTDVKAWKVVAASQKEAGGGGGNKMVANDLPDAPLGDMGGNDDLPF